VFFHLTESADSQPTRSTLYQDNSPRARDPSGIPLRRKAGKLGWAENFRLVDLRHVERRSEVSFSGVEGSEYIEEDTSDQIQASGRTSIRGKMDLSRQLISTLLNEVLRRSHSFCQCTGSIINVSNEQKSRSTLGAGLVLDQCLKDFVRAQA